MDEEKKNNELKEVANELLDWQHNKLIRTLRNLTTNPGLVISEYSKGDRTKYLSPAIYFFSITAVNTYLVSSSGLLDAMTRTNPIPSKLNFDPSKVPGHADVLSFLLSETAQKTIFLPIALFLTWLFYRKYNRSFKDNSWFTLYVSAHATLLSLPLMLYWYITKNLGLSSAIGSIVELGYWIWASKQFYILSIRKAIFLRIIMYVTFLLISVILAFLIGFGLELGY